MAIFQALTKKTTIDSKEICLNGKNRHIGGENQVIGGEFIQIEDIFY